MKRLWMILLIGFGTSCQLLKSKSNLKETAFEQEKLEAQEWNQSVEQVDSMVQNHFIYRWLIFPKGAYQWSPDSGLKANDGYLILESNKMQQIDLKKQRVQIRQSTEKRVVQRKAQKVLQQKQQQRIPWKVSWWFYLAVMMVGLFFYFRWRGQR
jgi:hypothetical protein